MKLSFGLKALFAALVLGVAASVFASVSLWRRVGDLEGRAAASRKALDSLTAEVLSLGERARSTRTAKEQDTAPSSRDMDAVALKLRALSRRLDALESGEGEGGGVADLVARREVAGLMSGDVQSDGAAGRPRIKLDTLAEKLGMSGAQKQHVAEVVNGAREEVDKLLSARGPGGRTMTEQIAEILGGEGSLEEKHRLVVAALSGNDVPGSDESYASAIAGIRASASSQFRDSLSDEQKETLGSRQVNLFGLDTGYSPIVEGMKNALRGGNP